MSGTIQFVDQTLRDGQQSLWGLRMRAYQAAEALPHLDRTGFEVVDLTGAGMFTVLLRMFRDDPWASTDFLVKGLPSSITRAGLRSRSVVGFGLTPDSIVDLWLKTLFKHGVTSFWIYDCLYDMETMRRVVDVVHDMGGIPVPSIMYGLTGAHDDEFFASRAREMASWPGVKSIYVEDAPGVLTPDRARTLLPAIREATGNVQLELHCHNTTGLAQHNYVIGLESGFTVLHTASRPMANGPSLPSTEGMMPILERMGLSHRLDETQFEPVARNFSWAAADAGFAPGEMAEYDPRLYEHQLPGGMTGTLKNQLAEQGMLDRWPQVLEEIKRVRVELGHPIMATPFSQLVGIQSVLNVIMPERYAIVPDEVIQYALGQYGPLVRPIDPVVLDRILSAPRAKEFIDWVAPQPSIDEVRARFPLGITDEELLLRLLTSDRDVEAMMASGPLIVDPRNRSALILQNLEGIVSDASNTTSLRLRTPSISIDLHRKTGNA